MANDSKLVRAKVAQNDCPECLYALLAESQDLGGLPLGGEIVMIPEHWLNTRCAHGRAGLRFKPELDFAESTTEGAQDEFDELVAPVIDTKMDATKNIGYPVREWPCTTQRYGSHAMHDPFDDESSPDGSGIYPGVPKGPDWSVSED